MSEIFLTSDNHFFHRNIIKYCDRPWADEDEMNKEMEKRWNSVVAPNDILINVGDLTAGLGARKFELAKLIGRLHGRKILIRGNHDHQKDAFYLESGILKVVNHVFVNGFLFAHVPGIEQVEHPHPMGQITRDLQIKHKPALTIHGHIHRVDIPEYPGHFNCASDRHNYSPFTLRSVLEKTGLVERADELYVAIEAYVNNK